jgi:hypothetical protein
MASVALIRADAGKPFSGDAVIKRLRELGLVEKASWTCTEDGRQVVGELVGIRYRPKPAYVAGVPESEPERTPARSSSPKGKFKPRTHDYARTDTVRDTICVQCTENIPKGSRVIWVQDEGVFHDDCVETS